MPFKSEKQRRYMWKKHPEVARRWADEERRWQEQGGFNGEEWKPPSFNEILRGKRRPNGKGPRRHH